MSAAPLWAELSVTSTLDGSTQPSRLALPDSVVLAAGPVPLIVCLHTWRMDYSDNVRGLPEGALALGWGVLMPNFRGPNVNPQACGSPAAVQDILDAVDFVHANHAALGKVMLLGTSGGGHMALLMASLHPERFHAVSAWVPISDLARWHAETTRRNLVYASLIEKVCGGAPGDGEDVDNGYTKRSPLLQLSRVSGHLFFDLNTGIRDGHDGLSVPVGHTLRAFGQLVPEQAFDEETIALLEERPIFPAFLAEDIPIDSAYGAKSVLLRREADMARVTVFDGGHEIVLRAALLWFQAVQSSTLRPS